jgi:hypothetical protein
MREAHISGSLYPMAQTEADFWLAVARKNYKMGEWQEAQAAAAISLAETARSV